MKLKNHMFTFLLLALFWCGETHGQHMGFALPEGAKRIKVDFETHNNLIVVPVRINDVISVKFIIDTGVQYPIITDKLLADFIGLEYSRRLIIQGPGENDSISAKIAMNTKLELPNGIVSGMNQAVLVLEEDYLNLPEIMGVDVYGIIGYDLFSRFIVEINYEDKYMVLHEPKKFKARRSYKKMDLVVHNTKPYAKLSVENKEGLRKQMNLMIDIGASHSLLIDDPDDKSILPSSNIVSIIGRGLGGDIEGRLGRVKNVKFGKFEFEEPIVSFPVDGDYGNPIKRGSRNGTIGSEFVSRFNIVFDYFSGTLYLKKNRNYYRDFEYDMSGMSLVADGSKFDRFRVNSVRYNSPAYLAGIKKGDIIKTINGNPVETISMSKMITLLRQKEGKKINLRVLRGEQGFKTSFKLLRYI